MSKFSFLNFFSSPSPTQIIKKNRKIWLWIAILLAIDWGSKYVFYNLQIGADLALLEPVFNLGISRGIRINTYLIWIISLIGICLFSYFWHTKQLSTALFILLIAGTLWNFVDRIWLGGVRDFISIGSFPVFNIADCYLSISVLILLKKEIFPCNCKKKQ